jgi:hypothetical protein
VFATFGFLVTFFIKEKSRSTLKCL